MNRDLTDIQRRAVGIATARTVRYRGAHFDADDCRQTATEAVLRTTPDSSRSEGEQVMYMARAAIGAVIDHARNEARARLLWSRWSGWHPERVSVEELSHLPAADDVVAEAACCQALAAIDGLRHPLPLVAARLAAGREGREIARELGVTGGMVTRHKARLRKFLRGYV